MNLTKQLLKWGQPHDIKHIVFGRIAEVESTLGKSYHRKSEEAAQDFCAVCLTCDTCIACGFTNVYVWEAAHAHRDDIALIELHKLGVRLLGAC